jgi:hypothetical protein
MILIYIMKRVKDQAGKTISCLIINHLLFDLAG